MCGGLLFGRVWWRITKRRRKGGGDRRPCPSPCDRFFGSSHSPHSPRSSRNTIAIPVGQCNLQTRDGDAECFDGHVLPSVRILVSNRVAAPARFSLDVQSDEHPLRVGEIADESAHGQHRWSARRCQLVAPDRLAVKQRPDTFRRRAFHFRFRMVALRWVSIVFP